LADKTGADAASGRTAASASQGDPIDLVKIRNSQTTTIPLTITSGSRNIATVGPPSDTNGAAIHAWTPSM